MSPGWASREEAEDEVFGACGIADEVSWKSAIWGVQTTSLDLGALRWSGSLRLPSMARVWVSKLIRRNNMVNNMERKMKL